MTAPHPEPVTAFVPVAPDADWETVRARVMRSLAADVPDAWSDHNPVDPGVTLAEAAAFTVADLHYRIAERNLDAWPLEVAGSEPDAGRHWYATVPAGRVADLAAALARGGPAPAARLEPLIRACASPEAAAALLSGPPWSTALAVQDRPAVVALLRARLVREVAQEQTHVVAEAVDAADATDPPAVPTPRPERDARAAEALAFVLPLWADEIMALVRRERRRRAQEALVAQHAQVRAATPLTAPAVRAALAADGLDPAQVEVAMAAAEQPDGLLPETLEDGQGRSTIWPPHPVQALTCEPVTAEDYARRARAHPAVRRSWAVPGRLAGIAWNGLPTGSSPVVVDPKAHAITLVVERVAQLDDDAGQFLRAVLRAAIGPEAGAPFPDWRAGVDDVTPRRTLADEVGASLLETAPVLVRATLVTGTVSDRGDVVAAARERLAAFFAAGRPESRGPDPGRAVEGPWPRLDQPAGGWVPGEAVRFTEVAQQLVADPRVLGVERLGLKLAADPTFRELTGGVGDLPVPGNAVPVLAEADCLRVRFSLDARCGDA